jgi:hypothetical protein
MYLLQNMILIRARMEEIARPPLPRDVLSPQAGNRGALRIKLDARRSRRRSLAG